jgi:mono/diheme cytochrome c family protein
MCSCKRQRLAWVWFAAVALLPALTRAAEPMDGKLFRDVQPLLKAKCLACHGDDPQDLKGQLDLRTRAAALKGGESGAPALVPGDPAKSPLFVAVTWRDANLQMPPKENDRLTALQIELVRTWIAADAPWPETNPAQPTPTEAASVDGVSIPTSGGRSPEWTNRRYQPEDIWAYQPVRRPAVPTDVIDPQRVANPLDAFLQSALKHRGMTQLASHADRRVWLRRLTFDLTGLPPALAEIDAFLADTQPDAEQRVIRRLLDSPRYGEQQARHWLDVVRYADTSGFSNDYERPHAWRYRDYVIRSFNADKPFDRFVVEQVAGDELDADDPELLIAAGFLRMGPWEQTGMTVAAVTRQQFLDDVTHHIGVTFLGQGLRCASCHDHKFDPVPTQDYYRLQAVFAPVQFVERPVEFLSSENTSGFAEGQQAVQVRLNTLEAAQAALKRKNQDALAAFLREQGVTKLDDLAPEKRPKQDYLGGTFGLSKLDLSLRKIYDKQRQYLERELKRFDPAAFSVYSGSPNGYASPKPLYQLPKQRSGMVPVVQILAGGALEAPGDTVTPGVLSAMFGANETVQPTAWNTVPNETEGRRLALAKWIASPENTLAARVMVNRVWQQHFGRGLVATPNNYGKMGAKPTHPELLDWLATWFVEHGWSLKRLHQLIVSSDAYHLAGTHPEQARLREIDSHNSLLAFFPPRRLAAEELRDALLAISGELNLQAGGPGAFPELNWEVALQPRHIMGSVAPAYQPSRTPAERHRRTLYAFRYRTLADPFLEVFNRPGSETSCDRRDATTVTPQVFALFNSGQTQQRSVAWALSLERQAPDFPSRLETAFRQAFGRPTTAEETAACTKHFEQMLSHHTAHRPSRLDPPRMVRRGMVEELTGELIEWDEDLPGMEDYVPDRSPADVSPQTRALAEVCLVLLNANEFVYVR